MHTNWLAAPPTTHVISCAHCANANHAAPGAARLKKFLMAMGMLYFIAGSVVRGCSTLAPK
jgi:hypothetical protein